MLDQDPDVGFTLTTAQALTARRFRSFHRERARQQRVGVALAVAWQTKTYANQKRSSDWYRLPAAGRYHQRRGATDKSFGGELCSTVATDQRRTMG